MFTSFFLAAMTNPFADAHAVLTNPVARAGQANGVGQKLTPYQGFLDVINTEGPDCGSAKNNVGSQPGPIQGTFTAGQQLDVQWLMTIPHDIDRENYGVRVAVHYGPGDSYAQNILLDAFDAGTGTGNTISATVTLPPGKTSENAVLQWMWAAEQDGGFYLGCSDMRIVAGNNVGGQTPGGQTPRGQTPGQAPDPNDPINGRGGANPNLVPTGAGTPAGNPPQTDVGRGGAGENGGVNPLGGTRPGSSVGVAPATDDNGGIIRGSGTMGGNMGGATTRGTGATSTTFSDEKSDNNMYYMAGGAALLFIIVVLYFRQQDKQAEPPAQNPNGFTQMPPPPPTVATTAV